MLERATYVVFGLIVLVLLALWWSMRQWEGVYGPTYAARFDDGRVMIASGAELFDLEESGRLLRRFKLKVVGLGPIVNDLQPLPDGGALVGDANAGAIMRCDFHAYRCFPVYDRTGRAGPLALAFKTAVDAARDRIYVSDSQNHRLLILGLDGRVIANTEDTKLDLSYPNELILLDGGRLLVADTGHGRIVEIDVRGEGFGGVLAEIALAGKRGFFTLSPIALRRAADGRLWVVLANNEYQSGEVVVLRADGRSRVAVDLGDDPDPLSLVILGDRVLVLDPTGVSVRSIAPDGVPGPDFGDAAFRSALAATATKRMVYGSVRRHARWVLVGLLIAAIALYLRHRRLKAAAGA